MKYTVDLQRNRGGAMGLFNSTRALYGENYRHDTARNDWDALNRELFNVVIEKWSSNGIALITNSLQDRCPLPTLHVRVRSGLAQDVAQVVVALRPAQFDEIFARAAQKRPDVSDCYTIRNLGLPDKSVVYLIEHQDKARRSLLVFGGTRLRGQLERRLQPVNEILDGTMSAPRHAAPAPPAGTSDTSPKSEHGAQTPPTYTTNKGLRAASDRDLVLREVYLDAHLASLDYRQRVELNKIKAEMLRRSRDKAPAPRLARHGKR